MYLSNNEIEVEILLATYQGEKHVQELLESLLNQTHPNIRILIRDDGSQDQTRKILKKFENAYPDKISVIFDNKNLGVIGNFSELLKNSRAKYVLFSDQDDYWLPNKVELSISQLKVMEKKHGADSPLLLHTNLQVVDKDLQMIDPSFWNYVRLNPSFTQPNRLLLQNCITGCTMAMNRALANLSYPIPKNVLMHDWWIALLASCFGKIEHIQESTLLYRQHSSNTLGAKRPDLFVTIKNFFYKKNHGYHTRNQGLTLLKFFEKELDDKIRETIQVFCGMKNISFLQQRKQILKYRFFKHSKFHNFVRFFLPFRY